MRHSSTNIYLCALAAFDSLYLIFAFAMSLKHYDEVKENETYIKYKTLFGKPLVDICSNTAVWLTVSFTIERFIGVCHPMKGKKWCTAKKARYVTVIVSIAACLVTFPEFFEKQLVSGGGDASSSNCTSGCDPRDPVVYLPMGLCLRKSGGVHVPVYTVVT